MKTTEYRADVVPYQIAKIFDESELGSIELTTAVPDVVRGLVLKLEARVLEAASRHESHTVQVEVPTFSVMRVPEAKVRNILKLWLQEDLAGATMPWLRRLASRIHVETYPVAIRAEEVDVEVYTAVDRRVCPHLKTDRLQDHLDFLALG